MGRAKKDGQYLNVRIESVLYRDLEDLCNEAGQTKTTVVERALQAYITDYEDKKEKLKRLEEPFANLGK